MIFILSEEIDKSTDIVCNWLYYSNFQFLRINSEVSSNFHLQIHINEMFDIIFINNKGENYNFNKFSKAWFRRGFFNFELEIKKNKLNIITIKSIEQHIKNEADTIFSLITYLFCEKYAINNPNNYNQNKLIALYEAQKIGFQIPQTL